MADSTDHLLTRDLDAPVEDDQVGPLAPLEGEPTSVDVEAIPVDSPEHATTTPSQAELDERLAKVRTAMAAKDLDALIVTDPANMYYLTGYNAWSFYMPQCLVVPASGEQHLFARAMDAAGAGYTAVLPTEQVHGYPEELVHRSDAHPYEWIGARARELGLVEDDERFRIGVESDSHFFTARDYLALASVLPKSPGIDSNELVNWVRVVKSPYEQRLMRIAGQIAQRAMERALESIVVGRRQCDVAAEILHAQASGTAQHGGDYPAIVPMLPTGDAAGTPHLTWSSAPFVEGEATTIELCGVHQRYHVPLARTIMLGEPPQRLADAAKVVEEAMAVTLEATHPGASCEAVHTAFNDVINRHGLTKDSRIGYSIGIAYPPDWGEHTISLRPGETRELEAGMTLHVILGMWMDGWGYELSEPVLVTPAGAERLTHVPQELTIRK
ncbi:MAG TPA: M24 family metallopeptidase [Segeticoccus sp.]|uniref:M24 family metallopeptidase n=1 Tax=Segeticoccus sp. TaxID=2706531 RepID=UPI002D7E9C71|nr:M24 family metallopeptidase [Segeticoccus sp.]HET8601992.1 M24 family metallopeptidase [Segeticoccus sp.]